MLHEYHVIYSVRYYPRFHVTAVRLWTITRRHGGTPVIYIHTHTHTLHGKCIAISVQNEDVPLHLRLRTRIFVLSDIQVWTTTTSRSHHTNDTRWPVRISQCHVMTCPQLSPHFSTLKPLCCQTIQLTFADIQTSRCINIREQKGAVPDLNRVQSFAYLKITTDDVYVFNFTKLMMMMMIILKVTG
jgi:hypothetical protein